MIESNNFAINNIDEVLTQNEAEAAAARAFLEDALALGVLSSSQPVELTSDLTGAPISQTAWDTIKAKEQVVAERYGGDTTSLDYLLESNDV